MLFVLFLLSEKCLSEQDVNENKFCFYFVTLAANYIGHHCKLCNTYIKFLLINILFKY